ncbi:MAG: helix-turn-helix domain-containing protein [Deltaproteobacteria bacterium]|nr:helix-turn-helix domain-containing protein [Deltaproteobacteria bacterium]
MLHEKDAGHALREYRKGNRLTLSQLARTLSVSESYLSMLERGLRLPGRSLAVRIEEFSRIPPQLWGSTPTSQQAN